MIRALVSFSGAISMYKGQTGEIEDVIILNDLVSTGYVEVIPDEIKRSDNTDSKRVSKN